MTIEYEGGCHCGNIRYKVSLPVPLTELAARYCSCGYCTRHGGIYAAHPDAGLIITIKATGKTNRYRFASMSTDFLICTRCGIPTLVLDEIGNSTYALLKLSTLDNPPVLPDAPSISMAGEDVEVRRKRRQATWIGDVRICSQQ